MEDLKKELKNLIANNKVDEALKVLMEKTDGKDSDLHDIAIKLSRRYRSFKQKSLKGLEANEKELSQIVHDTLETVQLMDDPAAISNLTITDPPKREQKAAISSASNISTKSQGSSGNMAKIGIGGLAVIGAIALGSLFIGGDGEESMDDYPETEVINENDMTDLNEGQDRSFTTPTADDPAVSVAGVWTQISQSWGEANDCADCSINVDQEGGVISIISNVNWSGVLKFDATTQEFNGTIDWGSGKEEDTNVSATAFLENGNLIVETTLQNQDYDMTFSRN